MNKGKVSEVQDKVFTNADIGGPVFVHVKNGRITSVEPLGYPEEEASPWIITARGRTFSPSRKVGLAQQAMAVRRRVYSPLRIKYPMKRVGFEPRGGRRANNRGKVEFERVSWEEALDMIASELRRIKETYGNSAILTHNVAHKVWGSFHYGAAFDRFFNIFGGSTKLLTSWSSWAGWQYGGNFIWGFHRSMGIAGQNELLEDALKNTQMVIYWATDPTVTEQMYRAHESSLWRFWLKELGVKQIAINPEYVDTAAVYCDKWIAPIPGTDTALAAAIAYIWIDEGTYDQKFLDTHTIGFDEAHLPKGASPGTSFKSYILGVKDGVPKTPEWAENITDVEAETIKALAKEWALKPTMLSCTLGACRRAYNHEWTRMMVTLLAMQGSIGKPGAGLWSTTAGPPSDANQAGPPGYAGRGIDLVASKRYPNPVKQVIHRSVFSDAILNPPVTWRGGGPLNTRGWEEAFVEYTYPLPGCSEVKMIYQYGGSHLRQWPDVNYMLKGLTSPKIEFIVLHSPEWNSECNYADIVLPVNTQFERNDLSEAGATGSNPGSLNNRFVVYQQKCVESLYESRSDYEIFVALAERLGFKDMFTEGNTEDDWLRKMYSLCNVPMTWEEFKKKGYYVFELPIVHVSKPALREFYERKEGQGLGTPSGKIEIYSQAIAEFYGEENPEIPPVPHYIPEWEGKYSSLARRYSLQVLSPHPKYRLHGQWNDVSWLRAIHKINGYEPVIINTRDAKARKIKQGDVLRVYNDRGQTLCAAHVTERIRPGVIRISEGSWYDPVEPGKIGSLDRGGDVNVLTSHRVMSEHAHVIAINSCLAEVEKWER